MTSVPEPQLLTHLKLKGDLFQVADHNAFLIMPENTTSTKDVPWVWYAPTLPKHPDKELWIFEQLLAKGIAIAGVDVGESYGSPAGRNVYSALYEELVVKHGLSKKPSLLARSRGGLMLYNWAAENPDSVACIAGIYPVCNLVSYPGLNKACSAYDMTEAELVHVLPDHNPIDRLAPLAKAGVPIFHVHGDSDGVVPIEKNSGELAKRYKALGGTMTLEVVKGGGHDLSPSWFHNQALVDFILEHSGVGSDNAHTAEDLNGAQGKIFHVNEQDKSFELLKETVLDPKTNEGKSRHTVYWTDQTRFIRVVRQNSFEGIAKPVTGCFRKLDDANAKMAAEGKPFVVMSVTLLADSENASDWEKDDNFLVGRFIADPASDKHRGGTVELNGKQVAVRLRGPQAVVEVQTVSSSEDISKGFWEAKIRGARQDGNFVVRSIEILPLVDPRTIDDPTLPRVLVIGDSISMNYHEAAKAALNGIANYYRVEGNAGPSDRGVACAELWLGDYTQKGLQWDLIQFNHGLHDLKQVYDEKTDSYGEHNIPLDDYKKYLEQEIAILKKTGAKLMWCSTTPVPNKGRVWGTPPMGRRKDEDLIMYTESIETMSATILLTGFPRSRDWAAKWIWHQHAPARNAWVLFRREFDLDTPEGARLFISADTRYRVRLFPPAAQTTLLSRCPGAAGCRAT